MFDKVTTFGLQADDIEVLDGDFVKTASENLLPDGHTYDPDFLYMRVRAVSAGEYWGPNKNADFFPEAELIKNYKTFLDAHAFKNHENKRVENAIGDVVDALWNDKMKYVELLIRIDRKIAPSIVRGFEKGFMTDVSMGCRIQYSICSICGNKARVPSDYCEHIKYQKHVVYDDGRRTYEINIGPKFHDISAVLNGADRTAKVTGLIIMGDKVAFRKPESIEKVASFSEALASNEFSVANPFYKHHYNNTACDDFDIFGSDKPMYKLASNKKEFLQKIAELKKDIKGKIISIAKGQYINEKYKDLDKIIDLFKMFYTDFLSKDQCKQIAQVILDLSNKNNVPVEQVFEKFLNMLEIAGIELSPLEFYRISNFLIGRDVEEDKIYKFIKKVKIGDALRLKSIQDTFVDKNSNIGLNIPSLFNMFNVVHELKQRQNDIKPKHLGLIKMKIIKRPSVALPHIDADLMRVIKPLIPFRSLRYEHFVPRIIRIIKRDVTPKPGNLAHFALPAIVKTAGDNSDIYDFMSMLGYSVYQDHRVKFASSQEYQDGLFKFASDIGMQDPLSAEMEKVAAKPLGSGYNRRRAFLYGAPLITAYSGMQRARINKGEDVSGFNRYVAENPANAALVQVIVGPRAYKKVKKLTGKTKNRIVDILDTLKKTAAGDDLFVLSKYASEIIEPSYEFDDIDMFKNANINAKMLEKYSRTQLDAIKTATIMYAMGDESTCNNVLAKQGLTKDDIANYLQISADCFKIEIEKQANFLKDTLLSAGQDILFNPPGVSLLTTLPGNLLDGAIFSLLERKMNKDGVSKNNKLQNLNNNTNAASKKN